jgi:hypothetical protein
VHQDKRIDAPQLTDRASHGALERALVVRGDQMRHDFRVGFGLEDDAARREPLLQLEVVLDDSVVHDHQAARGIAMRMRILFARAAVSGPSCVADPDGPSDRGGLEDSLKVAQLSGRPSPLDALGRNNGDAGRVVASIFESPQTLNQNGRRILRAHVTHDPAHIAEPLLS